VRWDDLVRGAQHVDEASQSDPVLVRADGSYLYSFTSVVDDIDFAVTHVIRGEDHVTNTGAQIHARRRRDLDRSRSRAGDAPRSRTRPSWPRLLAEPWDETTWKSWTSGPPRARTAPSWRSSWH
jgi:hypothetical protein